MTITLSTTVDAASRRTGWVVVVASLVVVVVVQGVEIGVGVG